MISVGPCGSLWGSEAGRVAISPSPSSRTCFGIHKLSLSSPGPGLRFRHPLIPNRVRDDGRREIWSLDSAIFFDIADQVCRRLNQVAFGGFMKSGNIVAVLALFTTATGQGLTQTTHTASEPPPAVTLDVRPPPSPERAAIRIGSDGQSITVEGSLGPGTAARFAIVVESAPNVKTIVLHSAGGMVAEADEMAAVVRDRRLDTYVETICLSACTMILLAGTDRAVAPVARIGFHRPYMPGRTGLMSAES